MRFPALVFIIFFFVSCTQSSSDILNKMGYEADGQGFLEAVKNDDSAAIEIFLKMPELINFADNSGKNAVMFASRKKEPAILKKLIDAGANLKIMDNSEKTPLHYAAAGNSLESAKILIEKGASPDWQDNSGRDAANTLASSVDEENIELFQMLIARSTDLERRDKDKKTLFIIAAEKGFSNYLKILMSHGVSPLAKDYKGKTALDYAAGSLESGRLDAATFGELEDYTQKIKEKL